MSDDKPPITDEQKAPDIAPDDVNPPAAAAPIETPDDFELTNSPAIDPEAPYGRNKDGTPAKKRGRKGGSEAASRLDSVTPAPPRVKLPPTAAPLTQAIAPSIPIDYDAMGGQVANLWFNGGVMLLGEEWAPNTQAGEHVAVKNAFRDYFKAKNATELDPGVILFITLASYTAARIQKPTIKSRVTGGWLWLKSKVKR